MTETSREAVEGSMRIMNDMKLPLAMTSILPLILEDFKEQDPEFYYGSRTRLKDLAALLKLTVERLEQNLANPKREKSDD